MNPNARFTALLTGLGLIGVASLLAMPIERLLPGVSPLPAGALRSLALIQPALLVMAAAWLGARLHRPVGLDAPALRALADGRPPWPVLARQARPAALASVPLGLLVALYGHAFHAFVASLGPETLARVEALTLPLATRLLYGGLTEEVMVRWGVMTALIWGAWRLRSRPEPIGSATYRAAAVLAALLFALGHLPILFLLVPSPPTWLVLAVMGGNLVAGIAFGVLFWRHGLEAAIMAHALSHAVAALAGTLA